MAWCPKCKNEYVDGFTHCPDCDVDLVDELLEEEECEYLSADNFENPEDIIDYLHQVSISSAKLTHLDEKDIDVIAISKKEFEDAKLHISVYLQNESLNPTSPTENEDSFENIDSGDNNTPDETIPVGDVHNLDISEALETDDYDAPQPAKSSSGTYTKLSDKYEDVKSSAYTLVVVGTIGGIGILLEALGFFTIPISPQTKWLFYTVMGGIFVAFIISGVISFMHAKQLKIDAEKEDELIEKILSWFKENYTKETVDAVVDTDLQEELLYFNRAEYIKNVLMHEFEDADEALIDSLIENIYSDLYE